MNKLITIIREEYNKINRDNIYEILDNFKFIDENIGYHHGQSDNRVLMYDKSDILLAKLDYVVYNNEITISYVESFVRGSGYGKIVMIYLAHKYGYENLLRSSLTPDGAKMRNALDDLFNFDYEKYIESQNKHYDPNIINTIVNPTIKDFLKDIISIGYEKTWEKWIDYLNNTDLINKYDFNDISEIAEWIKGSPINNNDPNDEPPHWVVDTLKKISK